MSDLMKNFYYFIEENLPVLPLEHHAEEALAQTLTPEQQILFEDYQKECFYNTEAERFQLFQFLLSFVQNRL